MREGSFEFLGEAIALPEPQERTLELGTLSVSDVITPSREFVACIQRFGILTPIVVFDDGTRLRVVDGRRRVAAARSVGFESIPATVYQADGCIPDLITMVLNEQRRENPVADFNAIQRLQRRGATEREVCEVTGMSASRIRRRMRLAALHRDLFEGLGRGELTVAVAEACAALPTAQQAGLVARLHESGRLTMSDVRGVRTARKADTVSAMTLEGLGALLDAATPPSLAEIAAALSTDTLQRVLDELPGTPRFDDTRQTIVHVLSAKWRAPLTATTLTTFAPDDEMPTQ
jgi:ParB/RepB/Spo0J family partition protein